MRQATRSDEELLVAPVAVDRGARVERDHRRPGPRVDAVLLAGVAVVIVLTIIRIVTALPNRGPFIFADETGYLFQARFFAHVGAKPSMGTASFYPPLYSVLLAPFAWITRANPVALYRSAQLVNILLLAVGFLLLVRIARTVFGLGRWQSLAAATLAAAYPATLIQSGLAWPESLLPVLFAALVLTLHELDRSPSFRSAAAAGAVAVALYATHQRAIAVPLVVIVGIAVLGRARRLTLAAASSSILTTIVLTVIAQRVMTWVQHSLWISTTDRESATLHALLTPSGWFDTSRAMAGMCWYLLAATFGLAALGGFHLLKDFLRGRSRFTVGTTLATSVAIVFTAATAMRDPARADHLVYGRYDEIIVGVFLVAAVAALVDGWPRLPVATLIGGAMVVLALGIQLVDGHRLATWGFVAHNILGVLSLRALSGGGSAATVGIRVLPITVLAIAGLAIALALARVHWSATVGLLTCAAVASALTVSATYGRTVIAPLAEGHTLSAVGGRLLGTSAVSDDRSYADAIGSFAYQYWLPRNRFLPFKSRTAAPPTDLVLSSRAWPDAGRLGARLAFVENTFDDALWVMPGPRQARMQREGLLLPATFPGPLPPTAYRSRIDVRNDRVRVATHGTTDVHLRVTHEGTGSPWPQAAGVPGTVGAVDVMAVWAIDGKQTPSAGLAQLPRTVYPGDTVRTTFQLTVPHVDGRAVSPGRYRVGFVPVQEGVTRFDAQGDHISWITVDVTG